jgi:hypothetical protein
MKKSYCFVLIFNALLRVVCFADAEARVVRLQLHTNSLTWTLSVNQDGKTNTTHSADVVA